MMAGGQPPFLLDLYPNAASAYSLRKLRTAYTGSAIRVRRASDNAEQNIGFDSNGGLNTASLSSFCSGTTGHITTWYDQTTNAKNLTQASALLQPIIFIAGNTIVTNNKPAITFNGTSNILSNATFAMNQPSTHILVMKNNASVNSHIIDFDGSGGRQVDFIPSGIFSIFAGATLSSGVSVGTSQKLFFSIFNSISSLIRDNSTQVAAGNSGTQGIGSLRIGNNPVGNSQYYSGTLQEIIFYNSDQSSNAPGIETDIKTFYGI
jgi:hypothetical protein